MRFVFTAVIACALCEAAFATPQVPDTLVFGGRKYAIDEVPMLGLWDYGEGSVQAGKQKPPDFDVQSTANWAGYRAQFEIRDSKLFLRRIVGSIDGKQRKNEEIIAGKRFPVVATWYTGTIHIAVGDFDSERREATAVILFDVEQGIVKSVRFAERMKPVGTWNGMPPRATSSDQPEGPKQH